MDSKYYKEGLTDGTNFGVVSEALAYEFPDDELGITLFKLDANYSMYSYERFFELDEEIPEDFEAIMRLWEEDIERMVARYDEWDNLSYFIPYYRNLNSSHCTCIVEFGGTEYYDEGIDVGDYIDDMLDGNGVTSYYERYNPDDFSVTDFWMKLAGLLL